MATMSRPMASRSNREGRRHAFPVDSPSFCLKIVTAVDLQDGKELPEPAVTKYGINCMADSIFLKVPNCRTSWPVELKKTIRGSRIWLQKGWERFTDFYSIDQDYFIVFSYEGEHSYFQVHIFNCSNMEIGYPICGGAGGCMSTPNSKGTSFPSASSAGRDQNNDNQRDFYGANNFKFGDKPSFRVTMTEKYLSSLLRVPSDFTIEHLCEIGSHSTVTLQTSGERTWTVQCAVSKCGKNARFNRASWRGFVKGNQLEAGDDCLFELIGERMLKVNISRAK